MGRPKKKIEAPVEAEESVAAVESIEEETSLATSWDVVKGDSIVRSYSIEIHGVDAHELAQKFAGKIGGEVKVS